MFLRKLCDCLFSRQLSYIVVIRLVKTGTNGPDDDIYVENVWNLTILIFLSNKMLSI